MEKVYNPLFLINYDWNLLHTMWNFFMSMNNNICSFLYCYPLNLVTCWSPCQLRRKLLDLTFGIVGLVILFIWHIIHLIGSKYWYTIDFWINPDLVIMLVSLNLFHTSIWIVKSYNDGSDFSYKKKKCLIILISRK